MVVLYECVKNKYEHARYKQLDPGLTNYEMLALVLYTGCDCNYDLCKSQRNGDYSKWKIFDYCLYSAIKKLNNKEFGKYKLYSGLGKVKLNKMAVESAFFPTYTSTSWRKDVAVDFMGDEGMLIVLDDNIRRSVNFICCDVSWISLFPDECEILIARSTVHNKFKLMVIDQKQKVQVVSLKGAYQHQPYRHYGSQQPWQPTLVPIKIGQK